jgi:glycogen synthase
MFGWEYPPLHSGGLGVACQGLVRGLLKHGVQITLVLPVDVAAEHSVDVRSPGRKTHCDIRTVASILQPYEGTAEYEHRLRTMTGGDAILKALYGPDLGQAVERYSKMSVDMTRDLNPDVIHCHDWMTYQAGIYAAKHHDKPLITHIHATELDRTDFKPDPWIAQREREGLLAADKVIAVSNYTKSLLVSHYGISEDKIAVVHNGHDASPETSAKPVPAGKRLPLVLFVGRLTVQKNPVQFLESARIVREHIPDAQFVMAGDGSMLEELIDRSCRMGLGDCMIFTGKASKKEVEALYAKASCFVMPSLSEPFGLVALEAIGHGVPVVLSKQSGASEVIEHGFKVDFWDTAKMADCIITILREEALSTQLGEEAPHILKRLTWKNQAGHVQNLYKNLLFS